MRQDLLDIAILNLKVAIARLQTGDESAVDFSLGQLANAQAALILARAA